MFAPRDGWGIGRLIMPFSAISTANTYYQAGADGICRWDTDARLAHVRLDSPAQVALWCDVYQPEDRTLRFIEIGGIPQGPFLPTVGL